ncbi:MAG: hypothetical protein RL244_1164 [Pseudomonadota bacterium]|jgi:hypothetical protein
MKFHKLAFAPTTKALDARIGKILRTTASAWLLGLAAA